MLKNRCVPLDRSTVNGGTRPRALLKALAASCALGRSTLPKAVRLIPFAVRSNNGASTVFSRFWMDLVTDVCERHRRLAAPVMLACSCTSRKVLMCRTLSGFMPIILTANSRSLSDLTDRSEVKPV